MRDFLAALGLLLVVEGIVFAAFPEAVKRAMAEAAQSPADRMRLVGLVSAVVGLVVVWFVRW
jgi:uncharacterized protein YjeT (DUF2065 family)